MSRKLVYSWITNGLWEVFNTGYAKATLDCPVTLCMTNKVIKAVYNEEFHEIQISVMDEPPIKKTVCFDIEDGTTQKQNSISGLQSNGATEQSAESNRRQKQH